MLLAVKRNIHFWFETKCTVCFRILSGPFSTTVSRLGVSLRIAHIPILHSGTQSKRNVAHCVGICLRRATSRILLISVTNSDLYLFEPLWVSMAAKRVASCSDFSENENGFLMAPVYFIALPLAKKI